MRRLDLAVEVEVTCTAMSYVSVEVDDNFNEQDEDALIEVLDLDEVFMDLDESTLQVDSYEDVNSVEVEEDEEIEKEWDE